MALRRAFRIMYNEGDNVGKEIPTVVIRLLSPPPL
jgi:hypothetical protein